MCACCPHGVVYAVKFLLRGESPRDHVDILLSFYAQPTLWICDIPGFVASHGNKRKADLFQPNRGRFAEETEDNVSRAKAGKLKVPIPELDLNQMIFTQCPSDVDHTYSQVKHPLTKSSEHYCGYDRFHEDNSRVQCESLRHIDIVPQCYSVNSQIVEQLFSWINKGNYFLTQMAAVHHISTVRLLLHMHNEKINEQTKKSIMSRVEKEMPGCVLRETADKRLIIQGSTYFFIYAKQIVLF